VRHTGESERASKVTKETQARAQAPPSVLILMAMMIMDEMRTSLSKANAGS
jgi:hypothetical protein